MKIISLTLVNYKCFEEIVIQPRVLPGWGSLTILSGGNQTGKTAILDAFYLIFEAGGHRPQDIRGGTKKATLTLVLQDDEGKNIEVVKTITPKSSRIEVTPEGGEPMESPQTWLNEIASGIGFNPQEFIDDPKKRQEFIQRVCPISFQATEAVALVYTKTAKEEMLSEFPSQPTNLDGLIAVRDRFGSRRKEVTGKLKQLEGTIKTLGEGLPAENQGQDWAAVTQEVDQKLTTVIREKGERLRECDKAAREAVDEATLAYNEAVALAQQALDAEKLRIEREAREARAGIESEYSESEKDLRTKQADARNYREQDIRNASVRQEYDRVKNERVEVEKQATALDDCVKAVDELRKNKQREMPIPGVELREGGALYVNDLPFDGNTSTSEQMRIALMFAGQLPNPARLVFLDRLESFDGPRFDELKQVIIDSGFNVFATKVTDGPLVVEKIAA